MSPGRDTFPPAVSRRSVLTTLAAGGSATLAGCFGGPSGGERSLNPPRVVTDRPTQHAWAFPRDASENPIVEVTLEQRRLVPRDAERADAQFVFHATVPEDSGYHHDSLRAQFQSPADPPPGAPLTKILVSPVGYGHDSFRVYRNTDDTIVELDGLNSAGTLAFSFIVDPGAKPVPETLGYEVEVTLSADGGSSETAVASATGKVPVVREDRDD
jgi:hypothetical protein